MQKITINRELQTVRKPRPSQAKRADSPGTVAALTARELEVLRLSADGYNIKEIAGQLYVSFATIDTHSRNLVRKMNARNMKHAIAMGLRSRMIK